MGTEFRVVLYAPDAAKAAAAAKAVFARVAALDRIMSDYDPESELMRLCRANDAAPGRPVAVSADLYRVLEKAQQVSKRSDGAFDVTVGPLVRLWRVARKTEVMPDPKELADAKAKVGHEKLRLDPEKRTAALAVPGMRLDLGGIAKGYAADEGLAVLRAHGVTRALVAASGDIAVADPPPGADGWVVEIPPVGKGLPARHVRLAHAAVSTSGDLFQFVTIGGVRYSHVLDPKTGLGLTGRRSVTVVAPKGIDADSLTKAASVLPPERAVSLIGSVEGAATFIAVQNGGRTTEYESERFKRLVVPDLRAKQ